MGGETCSSSGKDNGRCVSGSARLCVGSSIVSNCLSRRRRRRRRRATSSSTRGLCRGRGRRAGIRGGAVATKALEGNSLLHVWVSDVHASSNVKDVLVGLLDLGDIVHSELHGSVVDLVAQDNVATVLESTVGAHLDKVFVVLLNGRHGLRDTSSPIVSIQVPENGSQVQLGGNPTDTVINITESLK